MSDPRDDNAPARGTLTFRNGQVLEIKAGDIIRGEARYNAETKAYDCRWRVVSDDEPESMPPGSEHWEEGQS